jgi:hypothetical protein
MKFHHHVWQVNLDVESVSEFSIIKDQSSDDV